METIQRAHLFGLYWAMMNQTKPVGTPSTCVINDKTLGSLMFFHLVISMNLDVSKRMVGLAPVILGIYWPLAALWYITRTLGLAINQWRSNLLTFGQNRNTRDLTERLIKFCYPAVYQTIKTEKRIWLETKELMNTLLKKNVETLPSYMAANFSHEPSGRVGSVYWSDRWAMTKWSFFKQYRKEVWALSVNQLNHINHSCHNYNHNLPFKRSSIRRHHEIFTKNSDTWFEGFLEKRWKLQVHFSGRTKGKTWKSCTMGVFLKTQLEPS